MKICCDFLPAEYKAVQRNLKLVFAAIIVWALTVLVLSYKAYDYRGQLKEINAQVASQESAIQLLEGQINAVKYPQDTIRELISKYRFIKQAMGSDDYPYLEFFQALEEAVPINEDTGLRRVGIVELKQSAGANWSLQGVARHWDDILKFEDNLNESAFDKFVGGTTQTTHKQNFAGVRVFKVETKKDKVTFEMEFQFQIK